MSENVRQTAERVVNRLLDGDPVQEYDATGPGPSPRAGGPGDPMRMAGHKKMKFGKGAFSGQRPGSKIVTPEEDDTLNPEDLRERPGHMPGAQAPQAHAPLAPRLGRHGGRMGWRPESKGGSSTGTPKAWKKGKKTAGSGHMVAGKPGKVSYKEALMRQVLENIKVKKAMKMGKANKGKVCASNPGKVSYGKRHESETLSARSQRILHSLAEKRMSSGIKGMGKKKPAAVAPPPGKVSHKK